MSSHFVFHVVDTLHNGVVGSWKAFRMDKSDLYELQNMGRIPRGVTLFNAFFGSGQASRCGSQILMSSKKLGRIRLYLVDSLRNGVVGSGPTSQDAKPRVLPGVHLPIYITNAWGELRVKTGVWRPEMWAQGRPVLWLNLQ
jgi:hypothetical protein